MTTTYKEITKTQTVTRTTYEITCGKCGRVWTADSLYGERCAVCHTEKLEADFQAKYSYLIGGRITAVISDDDSSERSLVALVVCDEHGDYWRVAGERDSGYGVIITIEEFEDSK